MVHSILGSWDTLTRGCSLHVFILGTVPGMIRVSWDLRYSENGG